MLPESSGSLFALVLSLAACSRAAVLPRATTPLPDYVLQFAPISHLFSGEAHFPSDVATHLQHVFPAANFTPVAPSVTFANISSPALAGSDIFLTSKDNPLANPQASFFNGVEPDSTGFTTAPATIIAVEKPGGIVDAFYFYFYSYDHGTFLGITVGDHVGDWEHSMVRFVNGVPQTLYMSAHSGGTAYEFSVMPKMDGRPITFIATGTHANYATPGDHQHDFPGLFDQTDAGTLWDVTKNFRGFWFDNTTQTFSLANGVAQGGTEEPGEGVGWLNFKGQWGDKQFPILVDGQLCIDIPDLVDECTLVDGPTGGILYFCPRMGG
ncbi:hypothetical protein EIP86_006798 [Pleurotus ostreatoroseus]|nr:hypothetical protein EIP86_006798 [Pleurotus ostreatoroseus]